MWKAAMLAMVVGAGAVQARESFEPSECEVPGWGGLVVEKCDRWAVDAIDRSDPRQEYRWAH